MPPNLLLMLITLSMFPLYKSNKINKVCPEPSAGKLYALPGNGFCSLRGIELNPVFAITYDNCEQVINGESVILIPDNLHLTAKSISDVESSSEIIDHYREFTDVTSHSIGASVTTTIGTVSIGNSFSTGYKHMKMTQVKDKTVTIRVVGQYVLYSARFDEYSTDLHPNLKSKLNDALTALKVGNVTRASLILELLILTHGTHVISSIDLGGLLVKEDYISSSLRAKYKLDEHLISISASIGFAGLFKVSAYYNNSHTEENYEEYKENIKSSKVHSFGGVAFAPSSNVSSWVDSVANHMVTIDRSGLPLPYLVTPRNFPKANQTLLAQLSREWFKAIDRFNMMNLRTGCLNPMAKNFDFNANFGDLSCESPQTNYSFGGVYQSCRCIGTNNGYHQVNHDKVKVSNDDDMSCVECSNYTVNNYLTGSTSCPQNFFPVFLNGRELSHSWEECHKRWYWYHKSCTYPFINFEYKTYWCAPKGRTKYSNSSGLMFGGVFTSNANNPLNGGKSCPPYYHQIRVLQDLTICGSTDYELGYRYSVPFGGFFSCNQGNPLAKKGVSGRESSAGMKDVTATCADGYTQHTAAVDYDCLIYFCVKANSFGASFKEIPIILPPFQNYYALFAESKFRPLNSLTVEKESIVAIVLGVALGILLFAIVIVKLAVPKCRGHNEVRNDNEESIAIARLGPNNGSVPYQNMSRDQETGVENPSGK